MYIVFFFVIVPYFFYILGTEIKDWLRNQGLETDLNFSSEGYLYLWSIFQEKALKLLTKGNKNKFQDGVILWTSELTKPTHISK